MKTLIFTRQGAAAYVAAPLCVFLLLVTADEGLAASHYYYALVDVDSPGYELFPQ